MATVGAHHYFRRRGFERVKLPGLPGSPEFMAAYTKAMASTPAPIGAARTKPGSVAAAAALYYASADFKRLAPTTQVVRRAVLDAFVRQHRDLLIRYMPRKFVLAELDAIEGPGAKNWLKAIPALCQFCVEQDMIEDDPTVGIRLRSGSGDGFHTWDEDEIGQFESVHPIGSRERLALALGLYTAQRRGDVIRMGKQHVRDGLLHVKQAKTGAVLAIPIHPELQAILATVPRHQMTFITTLRGKAFDGKSFTQWFAAACDKAGLSSACTFHGLRKAAARRLAEAGCTVHEIAAITGHATLSEVERYTKAVDQKRLA